MEIISTSVEQTAGVARDILASLKPHKDHATLVCLRGDLGSGKTTFTQQLSKMLHVSETVVSPTFVIAKFYDLLDQKWNRLVHIDAYRMESAAEINQIGFQYELEDPTNLIIVEWPELIAEAIPDWARFIDFEFVSEGERKISYTL